MLKYETALLIVCRTINPFVTFDLLIDDKTPKPDVEKIKIGDLFFNLSEQDKRFGHHVVDDILRNLVDACLDEGFNVVLGKGNLVKGDYPTIRALAKALRTGSTPAE